ncbi:hypothetical protein NDU88_001083 [Pleurodeles waltl]|uniref:Uncharacterized protein n=1 Tax=Pleurodeles waltl TaxID=8319 RepID=A0AAV7Q4Z8_PLEWA|nr:hypothetical protein NDU88_001083 [Pleurodeles waltl]
MHFQPPTQNIKKFAQEERLAGAHEPPALPGQSAGEGYRWEGAGERGAPRLRGIPSGLRHGTVMEKEDRKPATTGLAHCPKVGREASASSLSGFYLRSHL